MELSIKKLIFSVLVVVFMASCQNSSESKKSGPVSESKELTENSSVSAEQNAAGEHPGKAVYARHCQVCHQADGEGIAGVHPPLGPGSWVDRDPKELIAIMMKGLNGKIEVNGKTYNSFMPSQAHLTNEEMADVLTYIRSSWGNNLPPVTADMVKQVRSGK
jgi:mono/diheme cytochrome c family protein